MVQIVRYRDRDRINSFHRRFQIAARRFMIEIYTFRTCDTLAATWKLMRAKWF